MIKTNSIEVNKIYSNRNSIYINHIGLDDDTYPMSFGMHGFKKITIGHVAYSDAISIGSSKTITLDATEGMIFRASNGSICFPTETTFNTLTADAIYLTGSLINDSQAVTKAYVDKATFDITVHEAVHAKTTSLLNVTAYGSKVGKTLINNSNGTIDSNLFDNVSLNVGDRVLVDNTAFGGQSIHLGAYTITSVGSAITPWILTRASDADTNSEVRYGFLVMILEGTLHKNKGFILITSNPLDLDVDLLNFTQYIVTGEFQAGDGLTKMNNILEIDFSYPCIWTTNQTFNHGLTTSGTSIVNIGADLTTAQINVGTGGNKSVYIGSSLSTTEVDGDTIVIDGDTSITITSSLISLLSTTNIISSSFQINAESKLYTDIIEATTDTTGLVTINDDAKITGTLIIDTINSSGTTTTVSSILAVNSISSASATITLFTQNVGVATGKIFLVDTIEANNATQDLITINDNVTINGLLISTNISFDGKDTLGTWSNFTITNNKYASNITTSHARYVRVNKICYVSFNFKFQASDNTNIIVIDTTLPVSANYDTDDNIMKSSAYALQQFNEYQPIGVEISGNIVDIFGNLTHPTITFRGNFVISHTYKICTQLFYELE